VRAAVAEGGGPHYFACDGPTTVELASLELDQDVILDGRGDLTLENAFGIGRVVRVEAGVTAELRGMTLKGGHVVDSHGGGIWNAGVLTLTKVTVTECIAEKGFGSAIWNEGELRLVDSEVSGNPRPPTGGPGITIYNEGGVLTLDGSVVSDNSGGIVSNGPLTVRNSIVARNDWDGVRSLGGSLTLVGTRVTGTLHWRGVSSSGIAAITDSTIVGNGRGGVAGSGTLTLTDSTVSGNEESLLGGRGGGLLWESGEVTITGSTISENAADEGAGIFIERGTLAMSNSEVVDNFVDTFGYGGGGIATGDGVILQLDDTTVSGNSVFGCGGGIRAGGPVTLTDATIAHNFADCGRAIWASACSDCGDATVQISGTTIEGDCGQPEGEDVVWISGGNNVESPGDTCGFGQPTDRSGMELTR
jgi:hypothetical protein